MNLREGRIGTQEALCLCGLALAMSGLFSFDSATLYPNGNSTYISIPLGACIAGLTFLLVYAAMRCSNSRDYLDMLKFGVGRIGKTIIVSLLFITLILAACLSLNRFMNVMHSSFYSDTEYYSIAAYIIPTIIILAWLGLETLGRVAKIIGVVVIFTHAIVLLNSTADFAAYKIAPFMGDGIQNTLGLAFSSSFVFLPALLVLLCITRGINGASRAGKIGLISIGIAIVACGLTQLALAYMFTYKDLVDIYAPLYRMSMITSTGNFLIRLDKAMIFIWLSGVMLTSAYYVYGASLIFARSFNQHDIRPSVIGIGVIILSIAIASHTGVHLMESIFDFVRRYGFLILFIPNILASGAAIIRANTIKKGACLDE